MQCQVSGAPCRPTCVGYPLVVLAKVGRGINRRVARRRGSVPGHDECRPTAEQRLAEIDAAAQEWENHPRRNARVNRQIRRALSAAEISGGRVLEIGARKNPRSDVFGDDAWSYSIMDIESHTEGFDTVIGDITHCPELDDGSYDVIISVDVLEHVNRLWLAASEITRLLCPGGISYTSTLFAWRYHPVPIDYWRFTPECLEFLFGDLETLSSGFDTTERRRDVRGKGKRDRVPIDALGGFRENWRVFHVGRR